MQLIDLIQWWNYVVAILKEIRRDRGYFLTMDEFTNRDPMRVNRQAVTKAVTKKVERRDRLKRAAA